MQKVVIFGASGFLGSWVTRILSSDDNYQLVVVTRPNSVAPRLLDLEPLNLHILREEEWPNLILSEEPDYVLSFDWEGVLGSHRDSQLQQLNIKRVLSLAEASKSLPRTFFLTCGSQAEVGKCDTEITEDMQLFPITAYGKSKAVLLQSMQELFTGNENRFAWLRVFSTYGPLESDSWLIPSIISALENNKGFELTAGMQNWNYLHAFDFATGVQKILKQKLSGVINIASDKQYQIREVALMVATEMGRKNLLGIGNEPYRDNEVMNLIPSINKLTLNTSWAPRIGLEQGIKSYVDWRLGNESGNLFFQDTLGLKIPTSLEWKEHLART